MPSPSTQVDARPDLAGSLMEFNLAAQQQGLIGPRVFPVIEVAEQSGTFGRVPVEELLRNVKTSRASGAGYNRDRHTFKDDSWATKEHGVEEPIDDRNRRIYRSYFDAEVLAANRARNKVLTAADKRVIAAVTDASVFTGAALTTAVSKVWSDSTATIVDDVLAARLKVYDNSGLVPNAIAMSWKTFQNVRVNEQIKDAIESAGAGSPSTQAEINAQVLASVFDVEMVIVAGVIQNTANQGAAASLSGVWPDANVQVMRVPTTNDIEEPGIGRTFHWSEDGSSPQGVVESYRDETVRSEIIRVRHDVDEKLLYKEAGHLLTGTAS